MMSERLRSRDPQGSANKCYTIYFEDGGGVPAAAGCDDKVINNICDGGESSATLNLSTSKKGVRFNIGTSSGSDDGGCDDGNRIEKSPRNSKISRQLKFDENLILTKRDESISENCKAENVVEGGGGVDKYKIRGMSVFDDAAVVAAKICGNGGGIGVVGVEGVVAGGERKRKYETFLRDDVDDNDVELRDIKTQGGSGGRGGNGVHDIDNSESADKESENIAGVPALSTHIIPPIASSSPYSKTSTVNKIKATATAAPPHPKERKAALKFESEANNNYTENIEMKKNKFNDVNSDIMFQVYQPWVIQTYGDSTKTKTITLKKQERIIRTLQGLEVSNSDSSKFRFWVKSKGFTMDKPKEYRNAALCPDQGDSCVLYVPNFSKDPKVQPYRRVAVVEYFFDIIFGVHVGLGGRSGRHAGQKRTYRTISESYAFLPREAVTKFLAGCLSCRKFPLRSLSSPSKFDDTLTESSNSRISEISCKTESDKHDECDNNNGIKLGVDWEEEINLETSKLSAIKKHHSQTETRSSAAIITTHHNNNHVLNGPFTMQTQTTTAETMTSTPIQNDETLNSVKISNELMNYYQLLKTFYDNRGGGSNNGGVIPSDQLVEIVNRASESVIEHHQKFSTFSPSAAPKSPTKNNIDNPLVNVHKLTNDVKISCKTTPPKKRYVQQRDERKSCGDAASYNKAPVAVLPATGLVQRADVKPFVRLEKEAITNPITSTYLNMTRSLGLSDDEALKLDQVVSDLSFNLCDYWN